MADVDTYMLADQHSDIRREAVEHTNEVIKEGLKENYATLGAIKDSRFEVVSRVESNADRLERGIVDAKDITLDRIWTLGRDTADLRAQVTALGYQVRDGFVASDKNTEIQALKTQIEAAKNTTYLSDKIGVEGEKTRELINSLKEADLNRMLIERNAEIVEERHHARHWRVNYDQAQFANLTSQLQAFQSQLAETRQGMVNFGTMAGVGQTSTANNVR